MNTKNVLKCPVCDWEITDVPIFVNADSERIAVCCDDCAEAVKAEPQKYAKAAK